MTPRANKAPGAYLNYASVRLVAKIARVLSR